MSFCSQQQQLELNPESDMPVMTKSSTSIKQQQPIRTREDDLSLPEALAQVSVLKLHTFFTSQLQPNNVLV